MNPTTLRPDVVFTTSSPLVLAAASDTLHDLADCTRRHSGGLLRRIPSIPFITRMHRASPIATTNRLWGDIPGLGRTLVSIEARAPVTEGHHRYHLLLRNGEATTSIQVNQYGRLPGTRASRFGHAHLVDTIVRITLEALVVADDATRRIADPEVLAHAASLRSGAAGDGTAITFDVGTTTPILAPVFHLAWASPTSQTRTGLLNHDERQAVLNDPIDPDLPTSWSLMVQNVQGSISIVLQQTTTIFHHIPDPISTMRGEAALAALKTSR